MEFHTCKACHHVCRQASKPVRCSRCQAPFVEMFGGTAAPVDRPESAGILRVDMKRRRIAV